MDRKIEISIAFDFHTIYNNSQTMTTTIITFEYRLYRGEISPSVVIYLVFNRRACIIHLCQNCIENIMMTLLFSRLMCHVK